jgi:hypothetical protein
VNRSPHRSERNVRQRQSRPGVQVVIESAKNQRVIETTIDGPILLAKLAPGTYTMTLTKTVTIAAQRLRLVDFRWR